MSGQLVRQHEERSGATEFEHLLPGGAGAQASQLVLVFRWRS